MKKGFVTFCTSNWVSILDNLVESVLEFSKYDITVYSINFIYKSNNDRVKIKPIQINNESYYEICKQKIFSTIDCDYDIGLILDTDMIVTEKIDNIFEENLDKIINSDFPLFSKHPHNAFESARDVMMQHVNIFTSELPRMSYVYASYLFSNKNKWFFKEVFDEMNKRDYILGNDEMIINCLLTKYKVDYDIGYNYLPNGFSETIDAYISNKLTDDEINDKYINYNIPVKIYTFHSHQIKDSVYTKEIINKIKNVKTNR